MPNVDATRSVIPETSIDDTDTPSYSFPALPTISLQNLPARLPDTEALPSDGLDRDSCRLP